MFDFEEEVVRVSFLSQKKCDMNQFVLPFKIRAALGVGWPIFGQK
jgi:hypothetical protein